MDRKFTFGAFDVTLCESGTLRIERNDGGMIESAQVTKLLNNLKAEGLIPENFGLKKDRRTLP